MAWRAAAEGKRQECCPWIERSGLTARIIALICKVHFILIERVVLESCHHFMLKSVRFVSACLTFLLVVSNHVNYFNS